jgi:hypothetical protein
MDTDHVAIGERLDSLEAVSDEARIVALETELRDVHAAADLAISTTNALADRVAALEA